MIVIKYQHFNSNGIFSFNHIEYTDLCLNPHFHKNIEFVYVEEGEMEITVNGVVSVAGKGDFAVILPYHIHSFRTMTFSKSVIGVFSNDFVSKFITDTNNKTVNPFIFEANKETIENFCNIKSMNTLRIMGTLYTICGLFSEKTEFSEYRSQGDIILNRMLTYINNHLTEDISLNSLADSLRYEKHYVSKIFNNEVKMNFRSFINMCRTENAREMLETTDKTIGEIAFECGFREIRTFNRAFREYSGCTPNEFRKKSVCYPSD